MIEFSTQAQGDIQARRYGPSGDADLPRAGQPALVGDLSRGRQFGVEQGAQTVEQGVILGRHAEAEAEPAEARETVDAIAQTFDDETLRGLFLENAARKLKA